VKVSLLRMSVVAVLVASASVVAAPTSHWFDQGNAFYKLAQFDSAAAYYQKVADAGVQAAALYYNLGNADFRLAKMGPAILYYEKARRLAPGDPDIEHNLRFARLNVVDRIPEQQRGFVESLLLRLHTLLPLGTQLWVLTGLFLMLSLFFAAGLFVSRNTRLWLLYGGSLILFVMMVIGISVGIKIHSEEQVHYAVVLSPSLDALNAPHGDKVLFSAHEGTTFRIRESMDNWCLVSLPNGASGWVADSALGRI
jgi:tetratricopeptide (TPR) repeat protein